MPELKPYNGNYYLWEYLPNIGASILFILLFIGATSFHCWKAWQTQARFCIAFCIGGVFEIIGYIARAVCYNNTADLGLYCIQSIFILLGPVFFAASIYMTLGRIIRSTGGEKYSIIRINWLTKVFVASDVISFLVQGTGSGMMSMESMGNTSKAITIVGLVIQLVMFGLFIVTSVIFEKRMDRFSSDARSSSWKKHHYALYAVSGLIMVRSIFRVAEYAMGQKGYLLTHEWSLYIFDSLLMFAVMAIWAFRHPGQYIAECAMLHMDHFNSK